MNTEPVLIDWLISPLYSAATGIGNRQTSQPGSVDMRIWMKNLFSSVFILVLGTFHVAEGQGQTYVVTGVNNIQVNGSRVTEVQEISWNERIRAVVRYFDGVYEKAKDGDYYVQLGFRKNHYMYHVIQGETAYWVLGKSDSNGTYEDVKAVFKSNSTQQNGPSLSNWFEVYDESQEGASFVSYHRAYLEIKKVPSLRVFPIEDKISETELLRLDGVETKRGVLCNSQKNQQWLFLEGSNQRLCDTRVRSGTKCHCKNCWDATLCKGVKEISAEMLLHEKGFNNKEGTFCEDQKGGWIYVRNSDSKCDSKCICKNCLDEEGCSRKGNISREKLVAEKGMQTEDGVACEVSGKRWDVIRKEDRRICDFNCDCQTCWDELSCPWMANFTRGQLLEEGSSFHRASLVFGIPPTDLETQGGHFTGLGVFCLTQKDTWQHILFRDKEFCNFICECKQCTDELFCSWIHDKTGQQDAIQNAKGRREMVSVIFNLTDIQLRLKGGVSTPRNIFCLKTQTAEEWIYIRKDPPSLLYCNGIDDCEKGLDEDCNFFSIKVSSTVFNVSREDRFGRRRGTRITERNQRGSQIRDGVVCEDDDGQWIRIGENDPTWCNGRYDCPSGLEEQFCPWFVSTSVWTPIYSTIVMFALGVLLFFVFTVGNVIEVQNKGTSEPRNDEVMGAVDSLIQSISNQNDLEERKEHFDLIHNTPGGIRLLIGSAFNFIIDPKELHLIAEFIQKEEEKIHTINKHDWKTCIRLKAGNDGAAQEFLDSLQPPGFIKMCKFQLKKLLIWATGLPRQQTSTRWTRFWVKAKATFLIGMLPLLKATFYILDYVKDFCLFLFLYHRMDFIDDDCSLLYGLIIFHGATVLTSGIIMGLSIQLSNDIIQLDKIQSSCCVVFLRILFFFCTPLMPIAIILRAVRLSVKKEKIIADWKSSGEKKSISRTWLQYNRLSTAKSKIMVAYSDLKIIEASTEAVFQMFTLLVFIIASILYPERSGLGLLKNDSLYEYTFLVLSLLSSYATIIMSILTSMKIRKKGSLLFRSKILLGISFSLQLISRLLLMVPTAILALPSVIDADISGHSGRVGQKTLKYGTFCRGKKWIPCGRVVEWDIRDEVMVKVETPFLNTRSERSIGEYLQERI